MSQSDSCNSVDVLFHQWNWSRSIGPDSVDLDPNDGRNVERIELIGVQAPARENCEMTCSSISGTGNS